MNDQMPLRSVRVERQRLKFAAAHMATFADTIEPLHGHNYAVFIEAEGDLAREGWVLDFGVLKRIGRELCDGLDHHFLLQGETRLIGIRRSAGSVELTFGDKTYSLPEADVLELPIENTTAELIAQWFWSQVLQQLQREGIFNIKRLTIGVEEAPGQAGWYSAAVPVE